MVCIPPSGGPLRQRQDNKKSASVVAARFRLVSLADWDWELGIGIGIGIATHVGALCADHAQRSAHVSSPRWVWTHRRSIGGALAEHRRRDGRPPSRTTNGEPTKRAATIHRSAKYQYESQCDCHCHAMYVFVCHHVSARTHARTSDSSFPALTAHNWCLNPSSCPVKSTSNRTLDFGRMSGEFYRPEQLGTARDS